MFRIFSSLSALTLALGAFAGASAEAATYNFYFPKNGDKPEIEHVEDDATDVLADEAPEESDESDALEVADSSRSDDDVAPVTDDEPARLEFTTARSGCQCVHHHPSGPIVLPPGSRITITGNFTVVRDDDLLSGTNSTDGLRLRPRSQVVRRTIVLDR